MIRIPPSVTVIQAARLAHLRGLKLRWRRPAAAPLAPTAKAKPSKPDLEKK